MSICRPADYSRTAYALAYVMAKEGLEGRIARLPCWQGKVVIAPLKGGLTNISYVATDQSGKYVVRCGEDIPAHHVFPDRERGASRAGFGAGVSPRIAHVAPGIPLLRLIPCRT